MYVQFKIPEKKYVVQYTRILAVTKIAVYVACNFWLAAAVQQKKLSLRQIYWNFAVFVVFPKSHVYAHISLVQLCWQLKKKSMNSSTKHTIKHNFFFIHCSHFLVFFLYSYSEGKKCDKKQAEKKTKLYAVYRTVVRWFIAKYKYKCTSHTIEQGTPQPKTQSSQSERPTSNNQIWNTKLNRNVKRKEKKIARRINPNVKKMLIARVRYFFRDPKYKKKINASSFECCLVLPYSACVQYTVVSVCVPNDFFFYMNDFFLCIQFV